MTVGLMSFGHPLGSDPLTGTPAAGWPSVWKYDFQSQGLSLRTGNFYQGPTSGYAVGQGVWAPCGASYMNNWIGYVDFGHGVFINTAGLPSFLSFDPTFPALGMIDITSNGVVLMGSDQYLPVRNWLNTFISVGGLPFLSSYLSAGYACTIGIPYAMRARFTISSGAYDFPAVWSMGNTEISAPGGPWYHNEIDHFERFVSDFPPSYTSQSTHIDSGGIISDGSRYDMGYSLFAPRVIETIIIHESDFIYLYTDGVLTKTVPMPVGVSNLFTDRFHFILNMAVGASWEAYPTGSIGTPALTVQNVEIFAPGTNTTGTFPPAPPTPKLTWGSGYPGGVISSAAVNGTVVASLSGALTYRVIPYLSTFTGLTVSGSNVVTSGTLPVGSFDFYIEGTDASGMPCLAAKLTATFSNAPPIQFIQSINSLFTSHSINLDIVGNTLYLAAGWSGVTIFDITNRANPVQTGFIQDAVHLNGTSGIRVVGNYGFCATEQSNGGSMTVVDLTTKTVVAFLNPFVPADPPTTGFVGVLAGADNITINAAGTIAYVVTQSRQNLAIIDISNPLAPSVIKEVRADNVTTFMAGCRDICINEAAGIAYVASEYTNNVAVIDISNPATAHIITTIASPFFNPTQRGCTLNAAKTRLYVVGTGSGFGGMDIWNVSVPSAPVFITTFKGTSSANSFYAARGIVVYQNYAYICSEFGNNFLIVDISNEAAPFIAAIDGPSVNYTESLWMRVQDGYAYIAQFKSESQPVNTPPGNSLTVVKINPPYPTPAGT